MRGGRPPSAELVAEMRHNYEAIGGRSPLTAITLAQAAALRAGSGRGVPVAVGMRNWQPFIKDALAELAAQASTRIIGIPLAPQFSTLSVQKYIDAATAALPGGHDVRSGRVVSRAPAARRRVRRTRARGGAAARRARRLHGAQPAAARDRRGRPLRRRSGRDGARRGRARRRRRVTSWRTRAPGARPSPGSARTSASSSTSESGNGVRKFLVVPIGFVCDHTEILFDIDVQAGADRRASSRRTLRRTESLNTSPTFIALLEDLVRSRL